MLLKTPLRNRSHAYENRELRSRIHFIFTRAPQPWLNHEMFLFLFQFSAILINVAQNGQNVYENQAHIANMLKMGKCFTTIVGQSD